MEMTSADRNAGLIAKTLLANRSLRQADLGEALRMDSGMMSRSLAGKRKWTLNEIITMAEFFDVSVALFFELPQDVLRSRCSSELDLALSAA